MIFFVVVAAAIYLAIGGTGRTEPEQTRVCFSTSETREKILNHGLSEPFDVMRSTAGRLKADAIGVKLCRRSENLVYEISLLRHDGRVVQTFVDAKTGEVIDSKNEH
jgi:uncharacterized protein YpmB